METNKKINMIELVDIAKNGVQAAITTVEDTTGVFDDYRIQFKAVPGRPKETYAPFGVDDQLPYKIKELVSSDEVSAQNKFFNVLTCYGAGIQLQDEATGERTKNTDALKWARRNALNSFFLEQITDIKHYFFAVCVIILSKDGSQINRIVHKEACYVRLGRAARRGHIPYM